MKNGVLVLFSLLFVATSAFGVYYIIFLSQKPFYTADIASSIPTAAPSEIPTSSLTPVSTIPIIPTIISTPIATQAPVVLTPTVPTPTPDYLTFTSDTDKFSVSYKSSRKLYQDTESSGNRYTFYLSGANIAVHTGSSWSWQHPDRSFTSAQTVSGQPTFVYEITSQTLIDIELNNLKYTIQCIHNNLPALRTECQDFIKSFKLIKI